MARSKGSGALEPAEDGAPLRRGDLVRSEIIQSGKRIVDRHFNGDVFVQDEAGLPFLGHTVKDRANRVRMAAVPVLVEGEMIRIGCENIG